jgi:hypothetical protein
MNRFLKGKPYIFTPVQRKQKEGFVAGRYAYIGESQCRRGGLFLFRSVAGKWLETFTEVQIADYRIERCHK